MPHREIDLSQYITSGYMDRITQGKGGGFYGETEYLGYHLEQLDIHPSDVSKKVAQFAQERLPQTKIEQEVEFPYRVNIVRLDNAGGTTIYRAPEEEALSFTLAEIEDLENPRPGETMEEFQLRVLHTDFGPSWGEE